MFASQCAAAMDNAQTTVALRMAYERSQEELRIVQTEYERTSTATSQAIKIFYSYAHEDKELRDELDRRLCTLKCLGWITTWNDGNIQPGTHWKREIELQSDTADLVLLLVSPNFINSDYCWDVEMPRALERLRAGEVHVVPISLRLVDWIGTQISELRALPAGGKPIDKWDNRDDAFHHVVMGIRGVVELMRSQP